MTRAKQSTSSLLDHWGKILAFILASVALTQGINSWGPCETQWKFQTVEAAQEVAKKHDKTHKRVDDDISTLANSVAELRGETKIIRANTDKILDLVKK